MNVQNDVYYEKKFQTAKTQSHLHIHIDWLKLYLFVRKMLHDPTFL